MRIIAERLKAIDDACILALYKPNRDETGKVLIAVKFASDIVQSKLTTAGMKGHVDAIKT